jgi:hypothetical protein
MYQIGRHLLLHQENKVNRISIMTALLAREAASIGGQQFDHQLAQLLAEIIPDLKREDRLSMQIVRSLIKTATESGLVQSAATIFRLNSHDGPDLENAEGSLPAHSDSLARLASIVMGKALAAGDLEEAGRIAQELQTTDTQAAQKTTFWQRKLELLLSRLKSEGEAYRRFVSKEKG